MPVTVLSTPAAAVAATPVAAEDEHRGRSADARPDGQLPERHHRAQYRDGVEEGTVDADRVQELNFSRCRL